MQVKEISNVRYGLQMPKPISGGCGQDKAADTFCIIQAGTRYPLKSPKWITSAGACNGHAAVFYCVESLEVISCSHR